MSEQPLLQVHNLKTYFYTEDGVVILYEEQKRDD